MDPQLQRHVLKEVQNQRFQQLSQQLTSTCWDKCITKMTSTLDAKSRTCIESCVERYIDVSGAISRQQSKNKLTFSDLLVARCFSNVMTECGITNIQDEADFKKRVLGNDKPVLVDFHASWCGPCKLLGPRLEEVMKSHMDSVLLAKVDVDANDALAAQYKSNAYTLLKRLKDPKPNQSAIAKKDEIAEEGTGSVSESPPPSVRIDDELLALEIGNKDVDIEKIAAVPTVIAMKHGKEISRFSGLVEKESIEKMITAMLH